MSEKAPNLPVELNENYQALHAMVAKDGSRRIFGVDEDGNKKQLKADDVLAAYGYEPTDVTKLDPTEGGPVVVEPEPIVDPEPVTPTVKDPEGHKHTGAKKREYTMREGNSTFGKHKQIADQAVAARKAEVTAQNEEVRRFELMGEVKNSPGIQRLNDAAQLQIYGSGDREWVNPATGQTLPPIKGRIAEILENRRYGKTEAERKEHADAYQASIDELLENGFELCQAKLIMDLREKDTDGQMVEKLELQYRSMGDSTEEAQRKARAFYDRMDKKRLAIVREGGVFTMRDYPRALKGVDLYANVGTEMDADEAEKKEGGEKLRANHEIVQHEPNADGLSRLGLEYALEGQEGAEVDWNMQKWSRDFDPSRQIIVTTASGNRYYVAGDRIYDLRASSERNRPVYFDIEELPNAKLGRGWDIPGFRNTSTVQKVEVGYKYVHEGVELGEKRGIDPFNAAESFLAGLDGDGEEPIEAIVVDDEHGDEIPEGGFDLPDDEPGSDEVSKRGGIRNAVRRAKAALVAGTGRLFGGARRETGEDKEKMSKGRKIALGIFAVGVAVGAGYAIYKGVNSGGGGSGNGELSRDAVENVLTVGGRNSHRAAEAQQAIVDAMSPEQRNMFSAMMDWQMNFMKDNGMDMNDPANWEKAAKMFTKGVTYASTRGQGDSLPMTS